jgi:hypothetical protein
MMGSQGQGGADRGEPSMKDEVQRGCVDGEEWEGREELSEVGGSAVMYEVCWTGGPPNR